MKNREEKLEYLRKVVSSNGDCDYEGPIFLFKYRPFDEHTYKMLDDETLFLSGAYRQDDETECMTKIDAYELYDYYSNNLKVVCVELIVDLIKDYCSDEVFQQVKQLIYQSVMRNGAIRRNILLDISTEIQDLVPEMDSAQFVNFLANIPEKLDEKDTKAKVDKLLELAIDAQNTTGICSFGTSFENDDLRNRYASKGGGYCVEYDLSYYQFKKQVLPVIYDDNRNTRIIMAIVGNFVGSFVTAISRGAIKADNTHYLRLFLSKYTKWEDQDEWRIIGKPDVEFPAPQVKRIVLGRNVSEKNEKEMTEFCKLHNIPIIKIQK